MLHTKGNILIRAELTNKEKYKFESGEEISIEKGFSFNLREDAPSFATIIHGEGLPEGAEALIHHNSSHETFHVQDLSREDYNIYAIPTDFLFCYREKRGEWMPAKDFIITKRVFIPYNGLIAGIEPEQMKQRLFCVKGAVKNYEIENKVLISKINNDYEIEYHEKGKPSSVIRSRIRDLLGIDNATTEKVLSGEYLIGNNLKEASPLNRINPNLIKRNAYEEFIKKHEIL